ncbi:SDR family oxidoreductase [Mycolicibacter arupensis]|uniref:SDR family oxidoreductase n=1 Tax=Mycolicibacter arupensis TaxID=342002 RepID=UPI0023F2A3EA|nr:SDR family oxidoreductase [Mycolicibacter arupensis]MDM2351378.1 SDR family oxidoreductase [Mycobacteroides abscessus]MDM2361518.1 SDR family oxidoreductase [Mycobacteroides abscessus]
MRIVVIGGTGLEGSKLVRSLTDNGHDAVAASPSTGNNAATADGLAQVLTGADVVVDVSNSPSYEEDTATDFFRALTTDLHDEEVKAGIKHPVALSVVGTSRPSKEAATSARSCCRRT